MVNAATIRGTKPDAAYATLLAIGAAPGGFLFGFDTSTLNP